MIGRTLQVIALLSERGALPGLTRGDIRESLGLPPDAEITARIREAETQNYGGFDVRCMQISKTEFRYWMPTKERERAKRFIANRSMDGARQP